MIRLLVTTLLVSTLVGCVGAPPVRTYGEPAARYVPPPGVRYVNPAYASPGAGYVWSYDQQRRIWGWKHPQRGWDKNTTTRYDRDRNRDTNRIDRTGPRYPQRYPY